MIMSICTMRTGNTITRISCPGYDSGMGNSQFPLPGTPQAGQGVVSSGVSTRADLAWVLSGAHKFLYAGRGVDRHPSAPDSPCRERIERRRSDEME